MDSHVEIGNPGYIGSAQDLLRVLDNSATLRLEPGVHVRATSEGLLRIARGSKIHAEGTPELPITFSSIDEGEDGAGEWHGIDIGGFLVRLRRKQRWRHHCVLANRRERES